MRLYPKAFAAIVPAFLLLAPQAFAQRVSIGVVAGGYANKDFYSRYMAMPGFLPLILESGSGSYVVGPSVDVRLFRGLSIEADALYKPLHYRQGVSFFRGVLIGYAPATVVTYQFPVLAKFRMPVGRRVRPFIEAGPSFRLSGNLNAADPSHFGISGGMGLEMQWGRVRIAPRVRYTRWQDEGRVLFDASTRPDQVEFLLGVSYAPASDAYPLGRRVSFGAVLVWHVTDEFRSNTETAITFPAGARVTTQTFSDPRNPAVGPLVEVSMSPRFSVEASAIPLAFRGRTILINSQLPLPPVSDRPFDSGGTWEFPVSVKARLTTGSWRPFLALGPSFRLPKETGGAWLSHYGVNAGAGVEVQWKRIRISPALRYTHWGRDYWRGGVPRQSRVFRNQLQAVIGVSF